MELLILAYACKTSCARNIVGVLPYLPYCKQSKMRKRGAVVSRLLADMINKAGKICQFLYQSVFGCLFIFSRNLNWIIVQMYSVNTRPWFNQLIKFEKTLRGHLIVQTMIIKRCLHASVHAEYGLCGINFMPCISISAIATFTEVSLWLMCLHSNLPSYKANDDDLTE